MSTRAKRSGGLVMRDYYADPEKLPRLTGAWHTSFKIDGVCVIVQPDGATVSRAGKPLYNVPHLAPGIYECFLGSWEKTVSALRSKPMDDGLPIASEHFYMLVELPAWTPAVDPRLFSTFLEFPRPAEIRRRLIEANAAGYEGLVLHNYAELYYKVKPRVTYDVPVIGVVMGKGKHAGRMGALMTPRGNVGTGFSDKQRADFATLIPDMEEIRSGNKTDGRLTIEVECMGLTPAGKFRHPRFLRVRWDK